MRAVLGIVALVVGVSACTTGGSRPAVSSGSAAKSSMFSSSPSAAPTVRSVTILGSGDVLIHPELWQQAGADAAAAGNPGGYDFAPMYAGVAQVVAGTDLPICELESPLAPPQGPFTGWPTFSSPPQVLAALRGIGYKSCTTASNHSIDEGAAGVSRTLDELDAAGLRHTGSARSAAEAATPLIITMPNGVKLAQLAYAFGFNGLSLPPDKPWLANLTDIPTILAAAHRAKVAGANIVVLSMHWGVEYNNAATDEQRSQAAALLASPDVDVILGDHPHVVEPFAVVNGKWVAYSMGNQISRHADPVPESREGVMPRFTFTETTPGVFKVTKAEAVATWMQLAPAARLQHIAAALADPAVTDRADLQNALEAITTQVYAMGAQQAGLIVD